jgi:hypothetical protein
MGSIINMLYIASNEQTIDYYIAEGHVYCSNLLIPKLNQKSGRNVIMPQNHFFEKDCHTVYTRLRKQPVLLFCAKQDMVCNATDLMNLRKKLKRASIVEYEGAHLTGFQSLQYNYFSTIDVF